MGWESFGVVRFLRFDFSSLFQGQTRIAKLRSAYMWSDLTLDLKVKREQSNIKVLITRLLLVVQVWDVKPTKRKSWGGNLWMWSDLTLDLSFKVKGG